MGLLDRYLYIRITSAEPERLLSTLAISGVEVGDVLQIDLLTIEMKVPKNKFRSVQAFVEKNGGTCKIKKRAGVLWNLEAVPKRPVLLSGLVLFLLLSLFIPERIFFITVTGNQTIPDKQILSLAEECGIQFAAKASKVRSEEVKNSLLSKLPELQWIGVTASGSVATIQVKERSIQKSAEEKGNSVCSIVALRDGTLTEQTVYKGNPLFQVGQIVRAGDILISGYTDCGIKLKAEQASGEVFAYTLRKNQFIALFPTRIKEEISGNHTCIKLRVGKKVINLCNHSGILDSGCDKIYSEEYWTLPGGFRLPVSVIKAEHLFYEQMKPQSCDLEAFQWMSQFAQAYLKKQMIAGEVLNTEQQWESFGDICVLTGNYACHEMIGQVKYEENLVQNAEDNGTNS